jgi:hypothetical protein
MRPCPLSGYELLTSLYEFFIRAGMDDSAPDLAKAIEQEEARLLARLAKIAEIKRLAQELDIPMSSATLSALPKQSPPNPAAAEPVTPPQVVKSSPLFDGTFAGLVSCYREHPDSPYHHLKHSVRQNYDNSFKRLVQDIVSDCVALWSAQRIKSIYDES